MQLNLESELTPKRFAEIGEPYLIFRDESRGLVAVCSNVAVIPHPLRTRPTGQPHFLRLSLYTADHYELLGILELPTWIADVAFHPSEPKLLIGIGTYDGGFFFGGRLVVWNWETNESDSLVGESRYIARCAFSDNGRIKFLMRPRSEEEFLTAEMPRPAPPLYIGCQFESAEMLSETRLDGFPMDPRLAKLVPGDPSLFGFGDPENKRVYAALPSEIQKLAEAGFEQRLTVHDLLWLSGERFAVGSKASILEIRDIHHGTVRKYGGAGFSIDLSPDANNGCIVNFLRRPHSHQFLGSCIYRWNGEELELLREFPDDISLSTDQSGNILVLNRRTSNNGSQVLILDPRGRTVLSEKIELDGFTNRISDDGKNRLLYLHQAPPKDYFNRKPGDLHKTLFSIHPDGQSQRICAWDSGDSLASENIAKIMPDGAIVRACRRYADGREHPVFERLAPDGSLEWSFPLAGTILDFRLLDDHRHGIVSDTLGSLRIVDLVTGDTVSEIYLKFDGIPTYATALAPRGDQLLVGTVEGRILLYQIRK